jgi:CubicO group peptidase (beta-lactamase class C family)
MSLVDLGRRDTALALVALGATRALLGRWLIASALSALSAFAQAGQASCATPAIIDDGWEIAEPASAGFDSAALCAAIDGVKTGEANIHGLVVARHGKLVAEMYRRGPDRSIWDLWTKDVEFGPTVRHDMRSISKSVTGLLFGIVRQRGKIGPLTTPASAFYPEYAELRSEERTAITLEHLLTMSSGLAWNESITPYGSFSNNETRLIWDWSPSRFVLGRPIEAQAGSRFNYNGGSTAVLADILVRASGTPFKELAREALFEPLDIRDWEWIGDLHGRTMAFAGLRLRPRDLAKIGQMLLARGKWRGRQIVPADWVAESLRPHITVSNTVQYGYQFWTGTIEWEGRKLAWSAAFGLGGQRLYLVPELDLAVVITAGAYEDREVGRTVFPIFRKIMSALRV